MADFKRALTLIDGWADDDPSWLVPDPGATRTPASAYQYLSDPIPFRDLPFGTSLRLGRGGTSSNRQDDQRSIQLFSSAGVYNGVGVALQVRVERHRQPGGLRRPPPDLPYEPPKKAPLDFDRGPSAAMARLLVGGAPGLPWPDFGALGAISHPSLGLGPIYRGRLAKASLLVLADQESQDDLFTGRAMTGDAGQRFQAFLAAAGLTKSYAICRVLPVDTIGVSATKVRAMVDHPQVVALYRAIIDAVAAASPNLEGLLAVGPNARRLVTAVNTAGRPVVAMKAWKETGAKADWQQALGTLSSLGYPTDISPTFTYDGHQRPDRPHRPPLRHASLAGLLGRPSGSGSCGRQGVGRLLQGLHAQLGLRPHPRPLTAAEQAAADQLKRPCLSRSTRSTGLASSSKGGWSRWTAR